MKSEKDFKEGTVVIFTNADGTKRCAGDVDYSEGEEQEGCIRIRQVLGNIMYVAVGRIFSNPGED